MKAPGHALVRCAKILARASVLICAAVNVPFASAGFLEDFLHRDVDVITTTDVTEVGRAYPLPTAMRPVYYMIIDVGETNFGRAWAGEQVPTARTARKWMMAAMREQNYLLADKLHPPTQLFVFGWGTLQGGTGRPALGFLGGDKVDLMWEQESYGGFLSPRVLLRGIQRVGITGKVWDVAESNLFLGVVRSYTMDSLDRKNPLTKLWETRFGCPADGLSFKEAMPFMIKAAAVNLGRETAKPVNLSEADVRRAHVDLGETKFLGSVPAAEKTEGQKTPPDSH